MMVLRGQQRGFTLIEILVAMTILAVIILIVSGIFQQSSSAWEAGQRKTELNMEGRAAIDLMAQELSGAVADSRFYDDGHMISGSTKIEFWTFGNATNGERVARRITYQLGGTTITRLCQMVDPALSPYPSFLPTLPAPTLAEDVSGLAFTVPAGGPYRTNLPAWVDIDLSLNKKGKYSLIKAWSSGPDGANGGPIGIGGDDIRSWESRL